MDLKYICKNDGYIIDRRLANPDDAEKISTYVESGRMTLSDMLPVKNEDMKKSIAEYAFDNMKENVLKTVRKKYKVKDNEIINFYFEGNIEEDEKDSKNVKFGSEEIEVTSANFNLDFEVEVKLKPKNFLRTHYNSLIYKFN